MQDFVLFDDAQASTAQPSSRLLWAPQAQWRALSQQDVLPVFAQIDAAAAEGLHAAVFVAFEAAQALAGLPVHASAPEATPLVEVLTFARASLLSAQQTQQWLQTQIATLPAAQAEQPCGVAGLRPGITPKRYTAELLRIAEHLRAGDSYQINFTWPLHGQVFGHPLALYAALRQAQPTRYSCLAKLGARWVLSFSPELFFARDGAALRARPMKGTAPRLADAQADAQAALVLAADPKNRAENLMILDLLRNDLGRLAVPGSVQVPERFTVEPYPTVWQMTSSLQAVLDEREGPRRWAEIFAALFPCGSVTGAPKRKSMEIIRTLEAAPRGLYTGALGFIDPRTAQQGPLAVFSVPIRTLEVDAEVQTAGETAGTRAFRLGVGSGVVIDSDPAAEWQECWDKLRFVTAFDPGFGLIETFAAIWPAQSKRIERHLARLAASAAFFGFACDLSALRRALVQAHADLADAVPQPQPAANDRWEPACAALAPAGWRTRLVLRKSGAFDLDVQPMPSPPPQPVRLLLAAGVLDSTDPFLRHKTTHRARYDAAWQAAQAQGAFDQVFCNERGELCEGARSSLLLRLDGVWTTPALSSGLLPGVGRQWLIDHGGLREAVLPASALHHAERLAVVNSLRGVMAAVL
ncbi:chorismate-binding protein [Thiomonas bhubaneswarensis]|uniref:Anthranilate/para-aminobenzoate synthases component I n=1 Tax=Thiomonas bhubaneswarensis TaxID=339866 RepID=A0A0K6I2Z4_9BURK|nr:chorismate-binding protein [Thiomonas bhubaneswarensis]CUA97456.1 Anthranilate/para-aminobenzoate synthases component I [Thiomonas bhubaneswarensis]